MPAQKESGIPPLALKLNGGCALAEKNFGALDAAWLKGAMAKNYNAPGYLVPLEKLHEFVVVLGAEKGHNAWMKDDYGLLMEKKILDICCGSKDPANKDHGWSVGRDRFAPWFCRALKEIGAHPVGLDIAPNDGEGFESHVADITVKGSLGFLGSGSFDAVNCTDVFGSVPSHTLSYLIYWRARRDSRSAQEMLADPKACRIPLFWRRLDGWEKAEIQKLIETEVQPHVFGEVVRILKEGGFFFLEHDGETRKFQKERGQLVGK